MCCSLARNNLVDWDDWLKQACFLFGLQQLVRNKEFVSGIGVTKEPFQLQVYCAPYATKCLAVSVGEFFVQVA